MTKNCAPFLLSFQKFFVPLSTRNKPNESSRNSNRSYMMQFFRNMKQ